MRSASVIAAAVASLAPLAAATDLDCPVDEIVTEIEIRPDIKHQQIEGFGFSGAFQRAQLLLNVTQDTQQELLDLIYNRETGLGFSILRNGIGSSNSSYNDWMNTILPESPGSPDGEFNYVWDEYDSGQFFLAKKAVEYGVERIYANAWSAPGFMKNNADDANGGLLCGVPGSFDGNSACEHDWRQAYADYLVKYIQIYAAEGIPISDVAWLNEPDLTTSYASMRSNAEQVADFLPILHKTLEDAGLDVGISCCEQTGWQATQQMVSQIQALGVEHLLTTWAGHEYTSPINAPLDTELSVWQSEYCDLNDRWTTAWDSGVSRGDGYRWASVLHRALAVGNVNAYLWWLVVQDEATNNNNNEKLIMVEDGEYFTSKRAWAFAHYSRYIRPDAYRVETRGGDLSTTAYENKDGSLVVVILNPHHHSETVNLKLISCKHKNTGWGKVTAWLTDEEHDIEEVQVEVDDEGYVKAELPARGLMTFKAVAEE
ncbi:glycoside hydrolase family 30 protein [Sodiomyces alcalophilus JCM 7366]|uniref:glycoside hydrolase family 30 protein n=1 Tax=Sodiomyces alcalophilus JCM 7366 TaxID=591952 RepID=UPI0039B5D24F